MLSCSFLTIIASGQCSCVLMGVRAKAGVERCTEEKALRIENEFSVSQLFLPHGFAILGSEVGLMLSLKIG